MYFAPVAAWSLDKGGRDHRPVHPLNLPLSLSLHLDWRPLYHNNVYRYSPKGKAISRVHLSVRFPL